jgi:hypothetical protein
MHPIPRPGSGRSCRGRESSRAPPRDRPRREVGLPGRPHDHGDVAGGPGGQRGEALACSPVVCLVVSLAPLHQPVIPAGAKRRTGISAHAGYRSPDGRCAASERPASGGGGRAGRRRICRRAGRGRRNPVAGPMPEAAPVTTATETSAMPVQRTAHLRPAGSARTGAGWQRGVKIATPEPSPGRGDTFSRRDGCRR